MKHLLIAAMVSLLVAGCGKSPRLPDQQAAQLSHRFDAVTAGMTRLAVIEKLGEPKSKTEQGRLRWEDRQDAENYISLEVGFDEAETAVFIEKTDRKQEVR